jgi:uncharacterized protein YjbI with pentapeptide repeats
MQDLQCWYRALDLEPGASIEEVNQAHRDLALVWHPDRLPKDMPRLQEKAHAKLQEINNARDRLREHVANLPNGKNVGVTSQNAERSNGYSSTSTTTARSNNGSASTRSTTTTTSTRSTTSTNTTTSTRSTRQTAYQQHTQSRRTQPRPEEIDKPEPQPTVAKYTSAASAQSTREASRHHKPKAAPRTPYQRPDLTGVDWSDTSLSERDLSGRNLTNANLSNCDLQDSFLHGTNLQGANLHRANLFRANLLQANLKGANLRGVNLIGADLSGADLSGADMTGAKIKVGTKIMVRLMGANLAGTIMPDGQVHI